jgi:hypothetical protein
MTFKKSKIYQEYQIMAHEKAISTIQLAEGVWENVNEDG